MTISPYVLPLLTEKPDIIFQGHNTEFIIIKVAEYYGITVNDIMRKCRFRRMCMARHFCMYFLRITTTMSMQEVSHLLGRKDHTTVLHGVRLIEHEISKYSENVHKRDYKNLKRILNL